MINGPMILWRELQLIAPVDLTLVTECLGVVVEYHQWPAALSGAYRRLPGGRGVIGLNCNLQPDRMRFTCAHELGHHFDFSVQTVVDMAVENQDTKLERACNQFAANLLMPAEAFRYYANFTKTFLWVHPRDRIRLIADRFGVSITAAQNRVEELRLDIWGA